MTELEIAYIVNRVTGLIAATFATGLTVGYGRVLDSDSALVRTIAWSICVLTVAAVVECLRVVDTDDISTHMLAIIYNLAVLFGSIQGLRAQWRMIPERDRDDWRWYSAPLYPPWRWMSGLYRFASRSREHLWAKSHNRERRHKQQNINFPDRRRGSRDEGPNKRDTET